ncbi:MAG: T9SS type A sorting domain-containing protein [Sphingobacteriaceae bacterium]|nr:T9SS type A sorting domain-containing protein [Sphingobacteriaceae bacterium]
MKKFLSLAFLVICGFTIDAQTVSKNYSVTVFADINNNCIYDGGDVLMPNANLQITSMPCYNMGAGGTTNCFGVMTGPMTVSVTCNTYSVESYALKNYYQPCASLTGTFGTMFYLPLIPSALNAALFEPTFGLIVNNVYKDFYRNGDKDTLRTCNKVNAQFIMPTIRNQRVCTSAYNGTVSIKIDGVTYDSFPVAGVGGTVATSVSTATLAVYPLGAAFDFKYNFPSTLTLSSGLHTISAELTPLSGYTQPSIMEYFVSVDSCGQVLGNAFVDCNSNCVKNTGEGYSPYTISNVVLSSPTKTMVAYPDVNGNYEINTTPGIYSVNVVPVGGFTVCNAVTPTVNIAVSSTVGINYGLSQTGSFPDDLASGIWLSNGLPGPGAVPGGTITVTAYNYKVYSNICGVSVPPTKFKVVLPPDMTFGNVLVGTLAPSAIISAATGDTIVWNTPGFNTTHKFTALTSTAAVMGSSYCVQSIVYPLSDNNPLNNIKSICNVYGGPYDPNSKESFTPGMAMNGDIPPSTLDLTYTIHFQNLGTGPAVTVLINDTIDSQLDLSSLQVLNSSFPVQLQVDPFSRAASFKFKNIYLPASITNEPASHGYVTYNIKLNTGLLPGAEIKNRAHIYFDYNSAITTNTTKNKIVIAAFIGENEIKGLKLYPNPTTNNLFISEKMNKVVVFDIMGREVGSYSNVNSINFENFESGMYIVEMHSADGKAAKAKIIKE